jgi:hypothetical protein
MFNPEGWLLAVYTPVERPEAWHLADLRARRPRPRRWWRRPPVQWLLAGRPRHARPGDAVQGR